jgi:hypothetical protein
MCSAWLGFLFVLAAQQQELVDFNHCPFAWWLAQQLMYPLVLAYELPLRIGKTVVEKCFDLLAAL